MIQCYTIPRIGNIKLKRLTTRHLQKLYKELLDSGRIHVGSNQPQGLSTTTVHSVHLMLHAALERAVKERLIPRNPTEDCVPPKPRKDAGLPHIRFRDLRHTFSTTALQNGVDVKTVSSILGHYDAGFTLRTCTHTTRQKPDEAAATMGSFMAQVM